MSRPAPGEGRCWSTIGVWGDGGCPVLVDVVHCHNCDVFEAAGRSLLERESDEGYVADWTELLRRGKTLVDRETVSLSVFRIEDEWLALKTGFLREVTEVQPVRSVPHRTGSLFRGLVNIRGELHLCVSLREMLGIEAAAGKAEGASHMVWSRMIVATKGGDAWVFPVDEVFGIQRVRPGELREVPTTIAKDKTSFTRGLYDWEDRTVGVIDEELLFYALKRRVF